jgi:hypothetical protein
MDTKWLVISPSHCKPTQGKTVKRYAESNLAAKSLWHVHQEYIKPYAELEGE